MWLYKYEWDFGRFSDPHMRVRLSKSPVEHLKHHECSPIKLEDVGGQSRDAIDILGYVEDWSFRVERDLIQPNAEQLPFG